MIARKSATVIAGKIFSAILGYLGLFLIIRYLGASTMGIIAFALSFIAVFNFAADLGFCSAHVKAINYGYDLKKCLGTFGAIRLGLTGAMVALILGIIAVWKIILHKDFTDATNERVIFIFIGYYVVFNLASTITLTFDARLETGKSQLTQLSELAVKFPLVALVIFLNLDVVMLALAYLGGAIGLLVVALLMFRGHEVSRPDMTTARAYASLAAPFMVLALIGTLWMNADKLILGYYWTAREVGIYYSVQTITNMLYMIAIALNSILLPALSYEYARKNKRRIIYLVHNAERYIAMIIIPCAVFILVFSESIISVLLSTTSLPAANALRLLAIFALFHTLATPYSQLTLAGERIWRIVAISAICVAIYLGLEIYLVAKWFWIGRPLGLGILGAALAWVLYIWIGAVWMRMESRRLVGTMGNPRVIYQIFSGFVLFCALYAISYFIDPTRWYLLIVFALLSVAIYLGVLLLLGDFTERDWDTIWSIVFPRRKKPQILKYLYRSKKRAL